MHIQEGKKYQVSCFVDRADMKQYGLTPEDFVNRTPLCYLLIKKARELAKESTDYEWPDCAYSMEIKFYDTLIELIFSERIEDFVFNLEQSIAALPSEQGKELQKLVDKIMMAEDEALARKIIRDFEENVKNAQR